MKGREMNLMYGEYHTIPYQSNIKEKFLWKFSLSETLWIAAGLWSSYQMFQYIPSLGSYFPLSYLHFLTPLLLCLFMCYAKEKSTKIPYWKYLYWIIKLRFSRRTYYYRKVNTVKGGDRYV